MWRPALSVLALVAYALFSHWLMVHAAGSPWAAAFLLGPLVASLAAYAAVRHQWVLLLVMVAGLGVLVFSALGGGVTELNRLYVLQHAGVHAALGIAFAATLRRGDVPMITRVALRVHGGQMPQAKHLYTRHVTQLWVGYFLAMVATSVVLYRFGAWTAWSLFANVGTPLSLVLLLGAEWRVRYWLHPEFERVPIATAMRAFRRPAATAP